MDQQKQPINVIVNQVENGYVVTETSLYSIRNEVRTRQLGEQDLRRQWVASTPMALAMLLLRLTREATPVQEPPKETVR